MKLTQVLQSQMETEIYLFAVGAEEKVTVSEFLVTIHFVKSSSH